MKEGLYIKIDKDTKLKASFALKLKGKDLTKGITEYLEKQAKEFENITNSFELGEAYKVTLENEEV